LLDNQVDELEKPFGHRPVVVVLADLPGMKQLLPVTRNTSQAGLTPVRMRPSLTNCPVTLSSVRSACPRRSFTIACVATRRSAAAACGNAPRTLRACS
jgi:hypothetical protein